MSPITPPSAAKGTTKRRGKAPEVLKSDKKKKSNCVDDDFDPDLDLDVSSDIKGIISALQQIREKAQNDDRKKNEEIIARVESEIRSMFDEAKSRIGKDRQNIMKGLLKSTKECESTLRNELAKFQADHEKFWKEQSTQLQAMKEIYSKYEDEREKFSARHEQLRKKEKSTLLELEKICTEKIGNAEASLKKKKQDDKSFDMLRKTLGSFLDDVSDDESELEEKTLHL